MRSLHVLALALALALAVGVVRAEPNPAQAAYCVAALKSRAEPVAERVRHGEPSAEAQLLPIVTASFAFIGSAYKQGVRQAEADQLVSQAERSQSKLPPAELGKVQDACQRQGQQLYDRASYVERQVVSRAAQSRIGRLHKASS
jgi:hypothetical protein